MKDHFDLSKLTFYQAIEKLYGDQLDSVTNVVKILILFCEHLYGARVNFLYSQMKQNRFKQRDFKFLVSVINDIDRIRDIQRQCRDYRK